MGGVMNVHKAVLVLALMLCLAMPSAATILVVDINPGNTAHYSSLAAAMSAASAGDTILVIGSLDSYGRLTLNKKLYLFGPGYLLASNPETQASKIPASASFTFNAGSAGSVVCGFGMNSELVVNTDNITIKRNYWNFGSGGQSHVSVTGTCSNIIIKQNYILNSNSYPAVFCKNTASNVVISNNYLFSSGSGKVLNLENGGGPYYVDNNVMYGDIRAYGATFTNNIWRNDGALTEGSNAYEYNLCAGTQFPDANGNQLSVDMGTVFVGTGTADAKWQLVADSPAEGAGLGGVDCGMFGGNDPYVLSGIPPIPTITHFFAPATASQASGLDVQLKAKARN